MDSILYTVSQKCGELLRQRQWQLTTAESCTGGGVAESITAVAGSSDWFECGFVTYSNRIKQQLLQVPATLLEGPQAVGAVSEETVLAMASGALRSSGAQCAIATSGVAGPGGGSPEKPVGTVWIGWAWQPSESVPVQAQARLYHFSGDRQAVRRQTVEAALTGLLQLLSELQDTG